MDETVNRWTIYMYTFPNGKRYIGATTRTLSARQGSAESGWQRYKKCPLLYEAIQEFGVENIDQTVLFEGLMENKVAAELESFFIEIYKTNANRYNNPSYGYNQTDGGEGTTKKKISEERREQLRKQMDAFHKANLGSHPTEETRRRQSEAHVGKKRGPMPMETRMKISKKNKEKHSPRLKAALQYPNKSHCKPVIMHDSIKNETFLFESLKAVGNYAGVNPNSVSRWISGTRRPPEGWCFVYAEDYDPSCGWDIKEVEAA